jgi:hypothetical protein
LSCGWKRLRRWFVDSERLEVDEDYLREVVLTRVVVVGEVSFLVAKHDESIPPS